MKIVNSDFRCGTIAIVGRPNVGKSTLLNTVVGKKISITSRKAQTTDHQIIGVRTINGAQFIFIDTPGFQNQYNDSLNRVVISTLSSGIDLILWIVEAGVLVETDKQILNLLSKYSNIVVLVNKIDRFRDKERLLPFVKKLASMRDFSDVVPLSGKRYKDVQYLLNLLKGYLPIAEAAYKEDEFPFQKEYLLASDIIREKVFRYTGQEIPYSVKVEIEKIRNEDNMRKIFAIVLVKRKGHKSILVGKEGWKIKQISTNARIDMEYLFSVPVYLRVFVKVCKDWASEQKNLINYDCQ